MSKALSVDLRTRVLAAVAAGATHREAAVRFGVSAASVSRWRRRERAKGDVAPGPLGGDRRSGRIEARPIWRSGSWRKRRTSRWMNCVRRWRPGVTPSATARCSGSSPGAGSRAKKDGARQRAGPPGRPEAARGLAQRPTRPRAFPARLQPRRVRQLLRRRWLRCRLIGFRSRADSLPAKPDRPLYIIVLSRYPDRQAIPSGWISL